MLEEEEEEEEEEEAMVASSEGGDEGAPVAAGRGEQAGLGGEEEVEESSDKRVLWLTLVELLTLALALRRAAGPFPEIPGRTRNGTEGSLGLARSSSWSRSAKHATDARSPREGDAGCGPCCCCCCCSGAPMTAVCCRMELL